MRMNLLKAIVVINIFDILLHIAINQPELLRIAGNVIIIGAVLMVIKNSKVSYFITLLTAAMLNLILNLIFIINNGIGTLGILLIIITTLLVTIAAVKSKTKKITVSD